jgi:hypothetical protein
MRYTITGKCVEWDSPWHVEAQAALDLYFRTYAKVGPVLLYVEPTSGNTL